MSSPFTRGTLYLKRRNQDLLAQLESNSAILQDRLGRLSKALTQSTREHPHSAHPASPPNRKRGYESWLVRNNSGQVSASLNPDTFWGRTPSPEDNPHNVVMTSRRKEESATATSPTKRAKKCSDQCPHHDRAAGAKRAKSKARRGQCPDCYCQLSKPPKEHGKRNADRVCVGCMDHKISDSSAASAGRSQRRTLEEARTLLRYSPESKFLKRLKERSKVDLDGTETSSPESTIDDDRDGGRDCRRHPAREPTTASKPSANVPSVDTTESSRPTMKIPHANVRIVDATESSRPTLKTPHANVRRVDTTESSRPTLKTPHANVRSVNARNGSRRTVKTPSNVTSRSDRSVGRDTESASRTGKHRDQPARDIPRTVADPYKPTTAPTRNVPSNIPPKNTIPGTFKTTYDLPKSTRLTTSNPLPSAQSPSRHPGRSPEICRPALSKLTPLPGTNSHAVPPPRVRSHTPPATRTIRRDPSPPRATNTRSQSKTPKHVSPANDRYNTRATNNKSKSARGKSRVTTSRGATSSSKKDSRTSPTASSSPSPSSSPTRGDPKTRATERTCPVETRENRRPLARNIPSVGPKRSKSKALHPVPSCYNAGDGLKTSPVGYSPGRKYRKKVCRPYCKKYRRKESCTTTTEGNENEERGSCLDGGSPTVERCKTYRRRRRKAEGGGASCCSHCCCAGKPRTARPCECLDPERDDWVDEIGRYRRSHWFDCHSYPDVRERPTSARKERTRGGFHRFVLNNRLFPTPLPCTISCSRCHHAGEDAVPREVTLDTSRRNRDVVPVVLPRARRAEEPEGPGCDTFRVYHKGRAAGGHKTHGCMLTHPIYSKPPLHRFTAPAQSLALRYQKGIV